MYKCPTNTPKYFSKYFMLRGGEEGVMWRIMPKGEDIPKIRGLG
jgi:hypothetical protein